MNVNEPETRGVALALHVVLDDLGKVRWWPAVSYTLPAQRILDPSAPLGNRPSSFGGLRCHSEPCPLVSSALPRLLGILHCRVLAQPWWRCSSQHLADRPPSRYQWPAGFPAAHS